MPDKLPAETLPKLRTALAAGKLPDHGEPGYDDVYDTWGDLTTLFDQEWAVPTASPARRHVAALVDLWSAIPFDGLLGGIAVNQPEVVPAAQEAAAAIKLPTVSALLAELRKCIPDEVRKLKGIEERHAWYESAQGEPLAAKLEDLEERAQEGDFGTELMEAVFRLLLAEPAEFFES